MLEAFVERPVAAAEVAEKTGESADKLQQISEEMDALKEDMRQAASADEVQHKLDELASRIEQVSESTSRAARLAEAAAGPAPRRSETRFVDKALQEEAYRRFRERAGEPTEREPDA
jgi:methyl-accepting chemotaxis protein